MNGLHLQASLLNGTMTSRLFCYINRLVLIVDVVISILFVIIGLLSIIAFSGFDTRFTAASIYFGWHLVVTAATVYFVQAVVRVFNPRPRDWRSIGLFNFGFAWSGGLWLFLIFEINLWMFAASVATGMTVGYIISRYINSKSRWVSIAMIVFPGIIYILGVKDIAPGVKEVAMFLLISTPAVYFTAVINGWREKKLKFCIVK